VAEVALTVEVREGRGKGVARRLRADGKVPATLYGHGIEPVALAVDARGLLQTLATDAGMNVLIDLHIGGDTHLAIARELSKHPVRGNILHVDFVKVARDQVITVDVPIHVEGEAHGVKQGGVIEHHLWQLHVECLPADVPERINVDVSALEIGDVVHVRDVVLSAGATVLTNEDEIILACITPQALKVEAELEAAPVAVAGEAPAESGASAGSGAE